LEAGHSTPGFRPIGYADLLGRLPEGVGQEAFFLGRQSRPAYFELFYWPASEHHFEHWPGKEAHGLMVDNREKKTP